MKKLVSLALVLALVFCVGCALADTLPKTGEPTNAYADVYANVAPAEDKLEGRNYPLGSTYDESIGWLSAGTIKRGPANCSGTILCEHVLTLWSREGASDVNLPKLDDGRFLFYHEIEIDHIWVDGADPQYEQLDKDNHKAFKAQKCAIDDCKATRRDPSDKDGTLDPHDFQMIPAVDDLLDCLQEVPLEETCVKCGYKTGKTSGSVAGQHKQPVNVVKMNYKAADCVNPEEYDYVCANCKKTVHFVGEVDPSVHHFGDLVVPERFAPTCTESGLGYRLCWACRDAQSDFEEVDPLGHLWGEGFYADDTRKPTCYKYGYLTHFCERKGCSEAGAQSKFAPKGVELRENGWGYLKTDKIQAAYYIEKVEKLPHTIVADPIYVEAPTCTTAGKAVYTCSNKDCVEFHKGEGAATAFDVDNPDFEATDIEVRKINALGHKWEKVADYSNCVYNNRPVIYVCTREADPNGNYDAGCSGVYGKEGVDYPKNASLISYYSSYEEEAQLYDEIYDGKQYNAKYDGKLAYVVRVDALGHDWGEWKLMNDYVEGSTLGLWHRTCKRCQASDRIIAEDPTKNQIEYEIIKEPTCTEAGEMKVKEYDQRDTEKKNPINVTTQEIPALGHDLVDVKATEATHTKPATTAGAACSRCDYTEGVETVEGSLKDGLCNGEDGDVTGAKEGEFVYFENGKVSSTKSGLVDFEGGKFYVKNGKIDTSLNGVDGGEKLDLGLEFYWFNNGQVADYSGLAAYTGTKGAGWFVVDGGKVDLTYMGLYTWAGQRFVISYGQWAESYNGFYWTDDEIVFVENGMVSTSSGLVNYDGAIFLIEKGVLAENFTGEYADHNGKIFNVVNGMVQ